MNKHDLNSTQKFLLPLHYKIFPALALIEI